jgi:hypothetical protein
LKKYYSEIGVPLNKCQLRVPFSTEHKEMLGNVKKNFVEHHIVATDPQFEKLITALRTAKENEGILDKEGMVHDDLFDAFRLSLKYYRL